MLAYLTSDECWEWRSNMKKRISLFLSALLAGMMLVGCGGASETNMQKTEEKKTEETEMTEDENQQSTESLESEEENTISWFDSHGLTITPQGEFAYMTMSVDLDDNDAGTFDVLTKVVITETTDGVEDGYKKVTAVFTEDVSASPEYSYWNYISAFDRYTGTSFEFDTEAAYTDSEDTVEKEDFVTIHNGDQSYNVSIKFEGVNFFPDMEETVTVICPIDYDGTVFQIGYCDSKLIEEQAKIDLSARLYTIDEFPYYGEGYYYFSYSNK